MNKNEILKNFLVGVVATALSILSASMAIASDNKTYTSDTFSVKIPDWMVVHFSTNDLVGPGWRFKKPDSGVHSEWKLDVLIDHYDDPDNHTWPEFDCPNVMDAKPISGISFERHCFNWHSRSLVTNLYCYTLRDKGGQSWRLMFSSDYPGFYGQLNNEADEAARHKKFEQEVDQFLSILNEMVRTFQPRK